MEIWSELFQLKKKQLPEIIKFDEYDDIKLEIDVYIIKNLYNHAFVNVLYPLNVSIEFGLIIQNMLINSFQRKSKLNFYTLCMLIELLIYIKETSDMKYIIKLRTNDTSYLNTKILNLYDIYIQNLDFIFFPCVISLLKTQYM